MQTQNETRLVQLEAKKEARITQFKFQMKNRFEQLQSFLGNPKEIATKT